MQVVGLAVQGEKSFAHRRPGTIRANQQITLETASVSVSALVSVSVSVSVSASAGVSASVSARVR